MKKLRVAVIAFFAVSALMITAAFSASIKRRPATRSIGPTVASRSAVRASQTRPMQRYASSSFTKTTPPPLGPGPTASAPTNIEVSPANLPHGRGMRGGYAYGPATPPTTSKSSAFLPAPSIEQEFLSRIAAKHNEGRVNIEAAKVGSVKNFDPDRDQETLVLDGGTAVVAPVLPPIEAPAVPSAPPPAGDDGGGHNRDQGGKPDGQKGNGENK